MKKLMVCITFPVAFWAAAGWADTSELEVEQSMSTSDSEAVQNLARETGQEQVRQRK